VSDVACAVLLTSELVTNVVRHARTDATITVDVGPPFRVEDQALAATGAE
jgi:anti-sigma regulatory factor (Ser/Thr protein kinase)